LIRAAREEIFDVTELALTFGFARPVEFRDDEIFSIGESTLVDKN